ncbi:MAG: T9SS type A sorting domain-containing protein, partial [Calditrichia bacterium]
TYTVQAAFADTIVILAQNDLISHIPSIPYIIDPLFTGIKHSPVEITVPERIVLYQNFPNPFNPATEIRYALQEQCNVEIVIYNSLGQKIKTLITQSQPAGYQHITWDSTNDSGQRVSSGVYFYRLKAGKNTTMKKMLLLR